VVVDKIKNNKGSFGFNAASEEFEDLMKAGIIDPTKVVRSAFAERGLGGEPAAHHGVHGGRET
jgi:chaperonin GroEL